MAIVVHGLVELEKAFMKIDHELGPAIRADLLEAAQPVASTARELISAYQGASLGTIVPKVLARGAYVYQNARKVTGKRGDYGALQMRKGLVPALEQHTEGIVASLEVTIDKLGLAAGF